METPGRRRLGSVPRTSYGQAPALPIGMERDRRLGHRWASGVLRGARGDDMASERSDSCPDEPQLTRAAVEALPPDGPDVTVTTDDGALAQHPQLVVSTQGLESPIPASNASSPGRRAGGSPSERDNVFVAQSPASLEPMCELSASGTLLDLHEDVG